MTNRNKKAGWYHFVRLGLFFFIFSAFVQIAQWVQWENGIAQKERAYFVAAARTKQLSQQIDSLGNAIGKLKNRSGFLNERHLAQLLARSHAVANDLEAAGEVSRKKLEALAAFAGEVLDSLQTINTQISMELLQAEDSGDEKKQQRLIIDLRRIRQLMQRCR